MYSIEERVHELYYKYDVNCAHTVMTCMSEMFNVPLEAQTIAAAVGMHGAGGFRAQCGLVEGGLMFIGVYLNHLGKSKNDVIAACYGYGKKFTEEFGSLRCYDLRPTGFSKNDPPHMCEGLTVRAVKFTYEYIKSLV